MTFWRCVLIAKKGWILGLFSAMVEIPGVALLESGARNGFFRKEKIKETHQLQLLMETDDSSNKRTILFFHPRKWMWVFFSFGKKHTNNHHKHIPKSKIKDSPLHFLLHHLSIDPFHIGKWQYFTNLDFPEIRLLVGEFSYGSPTTLPFGVRKSASKPTATPRHPNNFSGTTTQKIFIFNGFLVDSWWMCEKLVFRLENHGFWS